MKGWTNGWMNVLSSNCCYVVGAFPRHLLGCSQYHRIRLSLCLYLPFGSFVIPAFIFTHYMRVSKCLHENPHTKWIKSSKWCGERERWRARSHARILLTDFHQFSFPFYTAFYGNELNIKMVDSWLRYTHTHQTYHSARFRYTQI